MSVRIRSRLNGVCRQNGEHMLIKSTRIPELKGVCRQNGEHMLIKSTRIPELNGVCRQNGEHMLIKSTPYPRASLWVPLRSNDKNPLHTPKGAA
jgi:hypothetical protein